MIWAVGFAFVGLLIFLVANGKTSEAGRIVFAWGALAMLYILSKHG